MDTFKSVNLPVETYPLFTEPPMLSGLPGSSRRLYLAVIFLTSFPTARVAAQSRGTAVSVTTFPIHFEPNVGQVAPPIRFIARDTNIELRLSPGGFDLSSS